MNSIHIAEHCQEGLYDLQRTMTGLGWTGTKEPIPYGSTKTRAHWILSAEEWLKKQCEDEWLGIAYLEDGVLFASFKAVSDATAFRAACQSGVV